MSGSGESDDRRTRAESCAAPHAATSGSEPARVLLSEAIFGGDREVVILHRGMRYRLLQTRQGKLILNK